MNQLTLEFIYSDGNIHLEKSVFQASPDTKYVSMRGKNSRAYTTVGSFQWIPAVKSVCVLFLLALARCLGQQPSSDALLEGTRGSLASSLDYAVDKEPQWLCDMFGLDDSGKSNFRQLILRSNPGAKRPGPVSFNLNEAVLKACNITVLVDSILVHEKSFLENIVAQLTNNSSQVASTASFASSMGISQTRRSKVWRQRRAVYENSQTATSDDLPQIEYASDNDLEDIYDFEEQEFPGHHATKERLREWRNHDPSNFMCIKVPGEPLLGYYILFFLKPESMKRLLDGELLEDDIRESDLIQPTAYNYNRQTDAHICVFASKKHSSLFTVDLLWHLLGKIVYLAQYGRLSRLYAEATTPEGNRILERFKFKPASNPDYKGDPLFHLTLTPSIINQWQQWYTHRSFRQVAQPVEVYC